MHLLRHILDVLFPPRDSETLVRILTPELVGSAVAPVTVDVPENEISALLPYRKSLVRALIHEAKYRDNAHAHTILGTVLADYLHDYGEDAVPFTNNLFVLVPVPLAPKRLRERSYNQCERIASVARHLLGPRVTLDTHSVRRVRETKPQTLLRRAERLKNMEGAFAATALDPTRTYIVIDDVVTTGATLSAACSALRQAGATHILAVALAH